MSEAEGSALIIYGSDQPPEDDHVPHLLSDYTKDIIYRKTGFFGKGTYATCYEYRNTKTKSKFAMKVVKKRLETEHGNVLRKRTSFNLTHKQMVLGILRLKSYNSNSDTLFDEEAYKEANVHSMLRHEHIVRLYSVFEDAMNVYLVIEPCIFGSLGQVLKNRGRLSVIETRYYVRQIALGCEYLREQLVVHHDLKPNNIFIDERMNVKIGDFGLAIKLNHSISKTRKFCGTLNYLAPELIAKSGHSFEVDAWAIGCITYQLMVGIPPFKSISRAVTYDLIGTALYLPVPEDIQLPQTALDFIDQVLEVNPRIRLTPTQILDSQFLRDEPEIPNKLPFELLTHIPELEMNYFDLDELVTDFIAMKVHKIARRNRKSSLALRVVLRCITCKYLF